jgi:uncharacterized protein
LEGFRVSRFWILVVIAAALAGMLLIPGPASRSKQSPASPAVTVQTPSVHPADAAPTADCPCPHDPTPIHAIQGAGATSPLVGKTVTVQGVVTGDFQGRFRLGGFFVESAAADADANPKTSEGLFVYTSRTPVSVKPGDVVCVTGTVAESRGLTELRSVSTVQTCGTAPEPAPIVIRLPLSKGETLEPLEGMRVAFSQTLTVSDTYDLGRYGEVTLSNGRLFVPTQIAAPGKDAVAIAAQNARDQVVLDDGSSVENPDPIVYPAPGLTARHTLRCGDTVQDLQGIISQGVSGYLIEPTSTPAFAPTNPRTPEPSPVGGTLRIATFNVENYFNGDGCGSGFPTSRGAFTADDFQRQRDKLIKAIVAMAPDIIGLEEIENNGYYATGALHDLVAGLNAAAPIGTTYAYIAPNRDKLGDDEIAVALVYRVESVSPVGQAVSISQALFPENDRLPLAQTFRDLANGKELTIVVNHLKAKSSSGAIGANADQNDGQGAWNPNRVEAVKALLTWLATDPTGTNCPNVLIVGDMNAYTREDPITALTAAGYTDLVSAFDGPEAYTYVYQGEAGCLDHALASAALLPKVTGATIWHIDADEPPVLGYASQYKASDQVDRLYLNDPYRSSDHDPIVIGVDLGS